MLVLEFNLVLYVIWFIFYIVMFCCYNNCLKDYCVFEGVLDIDVLFYSINFITVRDRFMDYRSYLL